MVEASTKGFALTSTVLELRQANRSRVLRRMLFEGETTRGRLADQCELSPSTVANVVRDLIDEGLVEESGSVPSNGGRPITQLRPRPDGAYTLGVEVSEHGVTVELFDLTMTRRDREVRQLPTAVAGPAAVAAILHQGVAAVMERTPGLADKLVGTGLGVPGIVETDAAGGSVLYAQHLGWDPVPIATLFSDERPVFADNGAKTLAAAEAWLGTAREVKDSVVALIGHGIGAALIGDGRLLRGASGSAGEWGHTKIALDGPVCTCGARGCLEAAVGGGALSARWRKASGAEASGSSEEDNLHALLQAAVVGDPVATEIVDDAVRILGAALANLVNLFNPEQIVVGGWAGMKILETNGKELLASIRANSLERAGRRFRLEPALLGDDAIALGAALLPIEYLIHGHVPAATASL